LQLFSFKIEGEMCQKLAIFHPRFSACGLGNISNLSPKTKYQKSGRWHFSQESKLSSCKKFVTHEVFRWKYNTLFEKVFPKLVISKLDSKSKSQT